MATTRLSDVFVPEMYRPYMNIDHVDTNQFFDAGVATQNPVLDAAASSGDEDNVGGQIVTLPFWNDLDHDSEPNISNDDPSDLAEPDKIGSGKQVAAISYLNNGWSSMDLVKELAGSDPIARITDRTNAYWAAQFNRRVISTTIGLYRENVASGDGDMVFDISSDAAGNAGDDELIGGGAYIDAEMTFGDRTGMVGAIALHPIVYGRLRKLKEIEYVRDEAQNTDVPTYQGKRVIVSRRMPVFQGTNRLRYLSVLFGQGAIGYGNGDPRVPAEVERAPRAGNGGGMETLWERRTWVMHPFGYAIDPQEFAGQSPTLAELEDADLWQRVVDRDYVPFAFLVTNG